MDFGPAAAEQAAPFTTAEAASDIFGTPVELPDGVARIEASGIDVDLELVEARWPDEVDVLWCQDPSLNPEVGLYYEDGTFGRRTAPAVVRGLFVLDGDTWKLAQYESFPDTDESRTRPRYPEEHSCF